MSNKRRHERYKVVLPVKIDYGKSSVRCATMDVSTGGVGILIASKPESTKVVIEISGRKLKGQIVYSATLPRTEYDTNQYFRIGIQFSSTIDRTVVDQLRVHANMKSKTTVSL